MSKEKNLVYLNEYGAPRVSYLKIESLANGSWCGPAIDRLHEFEKLGLEPEEIERKLKDYEEVKPAYKGCCNSVYELSEEIETLRKELAWYTGQHSTLISQNRNQANTIKRLMDENEELRKECADRERGEERLHEVIKNQNELIEQLKTRPTNVEYTQMFVEKDIEIAALKQKIANFEQSMKLLNDCINERDADIEQLRNDKAMERTVGVALNKKIENLNHQLHLGYDANERLQHRLRCKERYIEGLEKELDNLRDKLEQIEDICTEDNNERKKES